MASTPGVAPYFDLSFQHASGSVLRAMRRFGDRERFGVLLEQVRRACPEAGVRSNFIVGFPGETEADLAELERFLAEARLDAIGVFGYSDEDGTEAARCPASSTRREIARRVDELAGLAEELMAQRAADRVGEIVEVLIEEVPAAAATWAARRTRRRRWTGPRPCVGVPARPSASMVRAVVAGSDGVDLVADVGSRRPDGGRRARREHLEPARRGVRRGSATGPASAAAASARRAAQHRERADRVRLVLVPVFVLLLLAGGTGGRIARSWCSRSPR